MFQQLRDKVIGLYKQHEILRNFSAVFSVDILVRASGFLLLPVYLKLMSQEEFGLYSYLLTIVNVFSLILNLSLYVSQSKLYHDYPEQEERGKLLFNINIVLLLGLLFSFTLFFLTKWDYIAIKFLIKTSFHYEKYRTFIGLGTLASIYSLLLFNYFMTAQKIKLTQIYNVIKLFFVNGMALLFLYLWKNSDKALVRLQYSFGIELLINVVFLFFYIKAMVPKIDLEKIRRSFKIAFPVIISALVGFVMGIGDKYFLEKTGSLGQLSSYYLATTVASVVGTIYTTFHNIWLPFFFKEKNWNENLRKTKNVIGVVFLALSGVSVGIYFLLRILLYFNIVSKDYNLALRVLPLILFANIVQCINFLIYNYMVYLEKTFIGLFFSIFIGITSIFLNYILIPRFNAYGAAFSCLLINIISILLNYIYIQSALKHIKKSHTN